MTFKDGNPGAAPKAEFALVPPAVGAFTAVS